MRASRRKCIYASLAVAISLLAAPRTHAEKLTITSAPSGATVEINGVVVCTTPCHLKYPAGYFHKTHTVFGTRLEAPMVLRVYKDGFTSKEMKLSEGPYEWVDLKGRNHGHYWLLKANEVQLNLEVLSAAFTGSVKATVASATRIELRPEMSVEQVVEFASPAVVKLVGIEGWGTGFFITDTGVIATNAHVARNDSSLIVVLPTGLKLLGKIVYIDPHYELALVKVVGQGFPCLPLADLSTVRPGQTVIAIGNPAGGMPNTVTKGIVSAVGHDAEAGSGTWIQTDASINPGNSGGPLLNSQGQVIGLNTLKKISIQSDGEVPLQGLGFALSASDLIQALRRFYPSSSLTEPNPPAVGTGNVLITSDLPDAEIYVDGKFVGQTPATIPLATGSHNVVIKAGGKKDWQRELEVAKDSQITLHPMLEPRP